ncbi:MAG: uracil-DNA glycosylase family protein [Candidatus Parabeggiatoa sp.]
MNSYNAFHDQYLKAMDIQLWISRQPLPELTDNASSVSVSTVMSPESSHTMSEEMAQLDNASQAPQPVTMNGASQDENNQMPQSDTAPHLPEEEPTSEQAMANQPSQFDESQGPQSVSAIPSLPETTQMPKRVEAPPEPPQAATVNTLSTASPPEDRPVLDLDWDTLRNKIATCTACSLHQSRTQTVLGIGNRQADLMFIGEAPGADEDAQGEPFVGRAGQLLTEMLYAIDLKREEVYIANVIKCRPPGNRDPEPNELACCDVFLQRQIALIEPKLIVAVGRIAAHHLLATQTAIGKLRGQRFEYGACKIPLIATYHPAYLLRRPTEKRQAWQDLQFIRQTLSELKT